MKTYSFHSGPTETNAKYLFNTPKHLALQASEGWLCYYALNEKGKCLAFVWINASNEIALSPLHAPFGSIETDADIEPKVLYEFIEYVVQSAKSSGLKKIFLKNPPEVYNSPISNLLTTFLLNQGFNITQAEISSVIPVSSDLYSDKISDWEHRKLKQAKVARFHFEKSSSANLNSLYAFLERCRKEKGYALSMSLKDVQALLQTFPDQILLFSVHQESELAAACVGIQVSQDILYTFYYDHEKIFDSYSPVVYLIEGIYEHCQSNDIRLLDLGTATLNTQPNFPLLTFKNNLGGIPSSKFNFLKHL